MSFIGESKGITYAPGYFLGSAECERVTEDIPDTLGTAVGTTKYVKAGTPFPANDNTAIGFVYEDVDVTTGAMPGSIVVKGTVITDRLPVTLNANAKTALEGKGFRFVTEPAVTRPY